jgi:hypothetical protein
MKTLKFNSNSWHYWLATKIGDFYPEGGDFCSYIRHVILGALVSLFMVAGASFVLYSLGREVYAAYTCWFTSVCTYGKFERAVTTGVAILIGGVGAAVLMIWNSNRRMQIRIEIANGVRPEPQDSFVKTAYKSIKEKTCFRVEFK